MLPHCPERLSYNTFDTISFDCALYLTVNAYPQSAEPVTVAQTDKGKTLTMQAFSPVVNLIVLPPLSHKMGFQKPLASQLCTLLQKLTRNSPICVIFGVIIPAYIFAQKSGRKSLTPLRSSCTNYRAPRTSTHSFTESVGTFTLEVTWLKSSFTHYSHPRNAKPGQDRHKD